jgi:hypothetical protein
MHQSSNKHLQGIINQPSDKNNLIQFTNSLTTIYLEWIDPGVTAYGGYRWRDVAGYYYSEWYRNNYSYNQPDVEVEIIFDDNDMTFHGQLNATHLKPNFAYQLKLAGYPEVPGQPEVEKICNEKIGLVGRWWQETWNGAAWANGQNLNNKGDGSSPNPNDNTYFERKDIEDPTSPTGKKYRYTGYLLFDYFITDENGDAYLDFEANSCYHVLWNTVQRSRGANDGPAKTVTFNPDPSQAAYDTDYDEATMTVFGEWERLPISGVYLKPGDYDCQIVLTEESFHGWPGGDYTGGWAAAMGHDHTTFTIKARVPQITSIDVVNTNQIRLEWTGVPNATYNVYRSTDPYFTPTTPLASGLTELTYTDTDAGIVGDPDHNYFYIVTAVVDEIESSPSNRVGEFDFELITTSKTNVNAIALAINPGNIYSAEQLAQAIPHCDLVSIWDASSQGYISHPPGAVFNNFSVQPGYPYFASVTENVVWTIVGEVMPSGQPSFSLITTQKTNVNAIAIPFSKSNLTQAEDLASDVPNCDLASKWDASSQGYISHPPGAVFNNFPVYIGYPYFVSVTANEIWL